MNASAERSLYVGDRARFDVAGPTGAGLGAVPSIRGRCAAAGGDGHVVALAEVLGVMDHR